MCQDNFKSMDLIKIKHKFLVSFYRPFCYNQEFRKKKKNSDYSNMNFDKIYDWSEI